MATGDLIAGPLPVVFGETWFAASGNIAGNTILAVSAHRSSTQDATNALHLGGIPLPLLYLKETQIGNSGARHAIAVYGGYYSSDPFGASPVAEVLWPSTTGVAVLFLIEGEYDTSTMQVAAVDSGAGTASSLSPSGLTPGESDAIALAGVALRYGTSGTDVTYNAGFATNAAEGLGGSGAAANRLTTSASVQVVNASTPYTATMAAAEECTAINVVIDQPGDGSVAATPDDLTLAPTVDEATTTVEVDATPEGLTLAPTVDEATSTLAIAATPDGLTLAPTVDAATSATEVEAAPGGLTVAPTVDATTGAIEGATVPAGLALTPTVDEATTTVEVDAAPGDLTLAITVDEATTTGPGDVAASPADLALAPFVDEATTAIEVDATPVGVTLAIAVDLVYATPGVASTTVDLILDVTVDPTTSMVAIDATPDGITLPLYVDAIGQATTAWHPCMTFVWEPSTTLSTWAASTTEFQWEGASCNSC